MTEISTPTDTPRPVYRGLLTKWSWRELWQGQLWPVAVALTLIIACVFALSALVMRVEAVMVDQGRSMIAADRVFRSANPLPPDLLTQAQQQGLQTSVQTRFGTMAFSDNAMQLVSVKSVDSAFPLRGELTLQTMNGVRHQVQPSELWLAARLFDLLQVKVGDTLAIGDADLVISGEIVQEPELSFNPFSQMPAVLIHADDLAQTGAIQPGSRVQYRAYFKGDEAQLTALQAATPLAAGDRWLSETTQGRTGDILEKARQYLSLTLILVIMMATATLVLTCLHYVSTRRETVAMMKSMGASRRWLWLWLSRQLVMLFALAALAGGAIGSGLEYVLRLPLGEFLPQSLPSVGFTPFVVSVLVALLVALPAMGIALWQLVEAPAIAVMQPQVAAPSNPRRYLLLLFPVTAALWWFGGNGLMWVTLAGLAILMVVLGLLGVMVVALLKRVRWGASMQLALSRISRSPFATGAQLAALTCSLMLLTVIWLLRSDLLSDWQQTLPAEAPNVFALNISPEQQADYLAALDTHAVMRSDGYPVIRGRITHINDDALLPSSSSSTAAEKAPDVQSMGSAQDAESAKDVESIKDTESAKSPEVKDESLRRELNFTWRETLPVHNTSVAGTWGQAGGVSVESGIADRLGIQLGDVLTFSVNSQVFSANVTHLRDVEWRNMRPNFYFIFTPDVMAKLPATWLVSFRIEAGQEALINQLGRDFPTVSLLDLRTMATRIQGIMQQISLSLSVLAGLGVVSGLLLVMTLLRLSMAQRKMEIKLYRTLGASRQRITTTVWGEYGIMALIAGVMAAMGAESVVAALVTWGFELPVTPHPWVWVGVPLLSLLLVVIIIRSMLRQLLLPLQR